MMQKKDKHRRIKAILFKDVDQTIVYELDSQGRHIKKMGRAKRTNYKNKSQYKEQVANEEAIIYSSEIDNSESGSYVSSPEPSPEPISININESNALNTINPINFDDILNSVEIPSQIPRNYDAEYSFPGLNDKYNEMWNLTELKINPLPSIHKIDPFSDELPNNFCIGNDFPILNF